MAFGALNKVRSVGLLANSTSPIGIDFGIGSLKMLQIVPGEQPALIAVAGVEVPDDIQTDHVKRLEFQSAALTKIIKAGGFKGRRAMCGIPPSQLFCKHYQFPKADPDIEGQIQTAIPTQLGCHPDALKYRHLVVKNAGGVHAVKNEVICFAVPHDLIRRIMESLRACKLEPVGMLPSALAMMRSFDPLSRREEDKDLVSLYLDIGAGATTCIIAHGKEQVFTKTIHIGGRHFDEAAAKQLKCSIAWARTQRRSAAELVPSASPKGQQDAPEGTDPAGGAADAPPGPIATIGPASGTPGGQSPGAPQTPVKLDLTDQVESLTDEISLCLRYHDAMFPGRRVSRAIFVGGEARNRAMCQLIAERLRLSAQIADPLVRLARSGSEFTQEVDLKKPQPGWAVALGLCLSPPDL